MTTRAEFLGRVRKEMGKTRGLFPATTAARPADPARRVEALKREMAGRWPETLQRFQEEFATVGGIFYRARSIQELPGLIGRIARERNVRRVISWSESALGWDLTSGLEAEGLEITSLPGEPVGEDERGRFRSLTANAEIGITGVDLAVAETGSLVLFSGNGRARTTSLLPDYHVALFSKEVLVESLEQLGVVLEAWYSASEQTMSGAMINVITGPSRTADVELTLTLGVHGPKEVHAIFVDSGL